MFFVGVSQSSISDYSFNFQGLYSRYRSYKGKAFTPSLGPGPGFIWLSHPLKHFLKTCTHHFLSPKKAHTRKPEILTMTWFHIHLILKEARLWRDLCLCATFKSPGLSSDSSIGWGLHLLLHHQPIQKDKAHTLPIRIAQQETKQT